MPFQIVRNDITKMQVDAIVNTANPMPEYGAGIDSAVYEAAGKDKLLAKRHEIGAIDRGTSVITDGYNLPAKFIIHTVGTAWKGGKAGEEDIIRKCYRSVFDLAVNNNISSLAIPLLASGSYGFPKGIALRIALSEIEAFMSESDMDVYLVVFDEKSVSLSSEFYGDIDEYINDNYVDEKNQEEYSDSFDLCLSAPILDVERSLDDVVNNLDKTFMELVFSFADAKGLTDVEVQKKANLDRKAFSKLKCGTTKNPSKSTALALAVALELDLDDTKDLLSRAGLALSPCSKQDVIVQYFIEKKAFDIYEINLALFEHGEQLLGTQV
ncbi:MAG: macro domain-containing protein [Butyrivibrio sp.]|uniref:macro domain-containing protein n=1 Tax=Butyrivibrio sp. TaxID=28121 RepID=UPI0025E0C457|nr:macro domain-containing protein [Butyrivibrio sp.]MCR5772414.1 macro domain-containing protein [Butyrivibrio sp.]